MTIQDVTSEGVFYLNSLGENAFICFQACNENWLSYRKRTESLSEDQIEQLREKDRTIGQRDLDNKPSFIELFTRPFTRFEFSNPDQTEEYRNLRDSIQQNGWTTIDLG